MPLRTFVYECCSVPKIAVFMRLPEKTGMTWMEADSKEDAITLHYNFVIFPHLLCSCCPATLPMKTEVE